MHHFHAVCCIIMFVSQYLLHVCICLWLKQITQQQYKITFYCITNMSKEYLHNSQFYILNNDTLSDLYVFDNTLQLCLLFVSLAVDGLWTINQL